LPQRETAYVGLSEHDEKTGAWSGDAEILRFAVIFSALLLNPDTPFAQNPPGAPSWTMIAIHSATSTASSSA